MRYNIIRAYYALSGKTNGKYTLSEVYLIRVTKLNTVGFSIICVAASEAVYFGCRIRLGATFFIYKGVVDVMKKALLKILVLCMVVCSALCAFAACGDDSFDASFNGTYYLYKNSRYDETNYIKLTDGKWEQLYTISGMTMPFISGTYEINDETIDFYATEGGEKARIFTGTIKEGVMKVNSDTFCMKGYTPQGKTNDNTANNDNNNQSGGNSGNNESGVTEYDVTYYLNYDGGASETKSTMDGKVNYYPSRTGYKFNGWYTDADCTTAWDNSTPVLQNGLKLYAEWVVDENKKGQLSAPTVSIDGDVFKWSPVTDASNYQISYKLESESEYGAAIMQNTTGWTFPDSLTAGVYSVRIRTGGDGTLTVNSPYVYKTYYHKCLAKASGAYIDDDTFYLKWNAVKNATGYTVKGESTQDEFETTVNGTSLNMSEYKAGRYHITITALRDGYVSSEYSADLNHKYLAEPSGLKYDLQTSHLNWQAVKYATSYKVYKKITTNFIDISYELVDTVTDTSFNMEYFDVGQHAIKVEALADGFISSSSMTSFDKITLKTPTLTFSADTDKYIIEWEAIKGANKYYLNINGNEVETTEPNYILEHNSALIVGTDKVVVSVYAFDDYKDYLQSNLSANKTLYDMSFFYYNSTETSCEITGIKDKTLTEIIIPNGVTSIGNYAFGSEYGNSSLITSITIPDSVTSIGEMAFEYCWNLTRIVVNDNNPNYSSQDGILYNKAKTEMIFVPQRISGDITLPATLISVAIRNNVTSFNGAFEDCIDLTSVTISDGITSIGREAFRGCSGLTNITIGNSVTNIGNDAFYGCPIETAKTPMMAISYIPKGNLKTVEITSGDSIGEGAFAYYSKLTSVMIGDSVTSIEIDAFQGCSSLTSITVASGNTVYHSNSNCIIETASKTLILGCKNSVIPADGSVTSIGSSAFYGCIDLTSIVIPDSVTSIGEGAFAGCSLTSVNYKGSVRQWTQIDGLENIMCYGAFYKKLYINNELLTEVVLENITEIKSCAFSGCSSLKSITIGNGVISIGDWAFSWCPIETAKTPMMAISFIPKENLKTVEITSGDTIGNYAFSRCSSLTSVTIPESVTSIEWGAFEYCSSLKSITIPNSVTIIGNWAFRGCSSLTSIIIPNSVTLIGSEVFAGCSDLTSVIIGNGVTGIYTEFDNCSSLTSVTIGNGITYIGVQAFRGCSSLTSINFDGTKAQWNKISKDSDWGNNVPATGVYCIDGYVPF